MKKIYIGCDDSGYEMKLAVVDRLKELGYEVWDMGSGDEPSRYPYYAAKVAAGVSRKDADLGILICGSGIGMSIAANKFPGVRASVITDVYSARLTRRHNDSNILCLGGRMLGRWALLEIVETWVKTDYDGGHHRGSVDLIEAMEQVMMTGELWDPDEIPYPPFDWDPNQSL